MDLNWNSIRQSDFNSYIKEIASAKILVIDDDMDAVNLMRNILHFDGFTHVQGTTNSRGAASLFLEFAPDLILMDLNMPVPDGFQLLRLLGPHIDSLMTTPVIVVTSEDRSDSRRIALANGAADYVTKPYESEELCLRVRNQLRTHFRQRWFYEQNQMLEQEIIQRTRELEGYELELRQAQVEVTVRLARAAEHHDDDTGQHTQRVSLACFLVAQELGMEDDFATLLRRASPLHDVGKIGVRDSILHKPAKLDATERQVMKSHCRIGAELLSGGRSSLLQMAESIAWTHHEWWDGSGYPHNLRRDAIPLEGRMVAVADVFDALVHDRPYKNAWSIDEALAEIWSLRGRQFDPDVVDAFMKLPHKQLI